MNNNINAQKKIINLFKKYNVKPKKSFGQNFLIDISIINKIIKASKIKNENIVEIGSGLGSLTFSLLKNTKSVIAYEIDKNMHKVLEKEIDSPKLHLIKKDFLKSNFIWKDKRIVIANLPYNLTTDILFKIIKNVHKFKSAILMVQKEFGLRAIAKPKTKEYGKLSVSLQSIADIKKILIVKSTNFIPIPKVDSIVLKINFKNDYDEDYFNFILNCFSQQRKTLLNNLKAFLDLDKSIKAIEKMKFKKKIRPQEISVNDFKKLWDVLK